jgi:hypothetical protein
LRASIALTSRSGRALTEAIAPILSRAWKAIEPLERPSASMWVTTSIRFFSLERRERCFEASDALAMPDLL